MHEASKNEPNEEWMGVYGWLTRIFSIKIKSILEIWGEDFSARSSRSMMIISQSNSIWSFCSLSLITDSTSTSVAANCHWENRKLFEIDRMKRRKQEWLTVLHDQFSLFYFHQWPRRLSWLSFLDSTIWRNILTHILS